MNLNFQLPTYPSNLTLPFTLRDGGSSYECTACTHSISLLLSLYLIVQEHLDVVEEEEVDLIEMTPWLKE